MDDTSSVKLTVCDAEYDNKTVMRLTAPHIPLDDPHFIDHLFHKFDPSGVVSTATHSLVVLNEEGNDTGKMLLKRSQLRDGLKLQLKATSSTTPVVGRNGRSTTSTAATTIGGHAAATFMTRQQFEAAAVKIVGLVAKQPRLESESTVVVQQGQQQQPENDGQHSNRHDTDNQARSTNRQQLTLDDAMARVPDKALINHIAKRFFNFSNLTATAVFGTASVETQRELLKIVLRVIGGDERRTESRVAGQIKMGIAKLSEQNSGDATNIKVPNKLNANHVLMEAWMRGMIGAEYISSLKEKLQNDKKDLKNKVQFILQSEYIEAAKELNNILITDEDVLAGIVNVLITQAKREELSGSFGFCEDGSQIFVPNAALVSEVRRSTNATADRVRAKLGIVDHERWPIVHTVSKEDTLVLKQAAQCVLKVVCDLSTVQEGDERLPGARRVPSSEVVDAVMASSEKNPLGLTSTGNVDLLLNWCAARGLVRRKDVMARNVIVSDWLICNQDVLTTEPSSIDLRRANEQSVLNTADVLSLLREFFTAETESPPRTIKSMFDEFLRNKCGGQHTVNSVPMFTWCLVRLVDLGMLKIIRKATEKEEEEEEEVVSLPYTGLLDGIPVPDFNTMFIRPCPLMFSSSEWANATLAPIPGPFGNSPPYLKEHDLWNKVLAVSAVVSSSILVLGSSSNVRANDTWMLVKAKWAMMNFPEEPRKLRRFAYREPFGDEEWSEFWQFLEGSGAVTWNPGLCEFEVKEGLFEAMYYTFLVRLKVALKPMYFNKTAPKGAKNRRGSSKPFMAQFVELLNGNNVGNNQKETFSEGITQAKFTAEACRCFLHKAHLDNIVGFSLYNFRRIHAITSYDASAFKHTINTLLKSGRVNSIIEEANRECVGGTVPHWLLVPSGRAKPHFNVEVDEKEERIDAEDERSATDDGDVHF